VPVEELTQAPVVVDGAGARTPGDKQLEPGDAEGVLNVDRDQADPECIVGGRAQPMLAGPRLALPRQLLVGRAPDLADLLWVEMGRNRKHPPSLEARCRPPAPPTRRSTCSSSTAASSTRRSTATRSSACSHPVRRSSWTTSRRGGPGRTPCASSGTTILQSRPSRSSRRRKPPQSSAPAPVDAAPKARDNESGWTGWWCFATKSQRGCRCSSPFSWS